MDMTQLRRELRRYMNGRIPYQAMVMDIPDVPMTVTVLPPSADTLLLLGQRVKLLEREDDDAAAVLAEVRRAAARYPDDTLATLVQARAEMNAGDAAVGTTLAQGLLEREPTNVEALQLLAEARLKASRDADDLGDSDRLRAEASRYLGRAYRADEANYRTFMLLAQTRSGQPGYPNENDIATLELARQLAPQLSGTVLNLAAALIHTGKTDEAVALLEPLANNPHGGGGAGAARSMINTAKGISDDEDEAAEPAPEAEPEDTGT